MRSGQKRDTLAQVRREDRRAQRDLVDGLGDVGEGDQDDPESRPGDAPEPRRRRQHGEERGGQGNVDGGEASVVPNSGTEEQNAQSHDQRRRAEHRHQQPAGDRFDDGGPDGEGCNVHGGVRRAVVNEVARDDAPPVTQQDGAAVQLEHALRPDPDRQSGQGQGQPGTATQQHGGPRRRDPS